MTFTMNKINIDSSTQRYQIPAVLTLPKQKNCPIVIFCHGTGSDKNEVGNGYVDLAKCLAVHGIASLRFDFIGTGESKVDYIEYSFTSAQRDIQDVLAYLEMCEVVNKDAMGILGWSQGGAMALLAAGQDSRFKSVVTLAGACDMSSLVDEAGFDMAKEQGYTMLEFGFRDPLRLSLEWINNMKETDILSVFSKSKAPILAIAGTADDVVDPQWAERIVAVSSNACSKVEWIAGADHCFNLLTKDHQAFHQVMALSVNWFKETLG